jgi:hypothetical protein
MGWPAGRTGTQRLGYVLADFTEMVKRSLLILNRSAATGYGDEVPIRLKNALAAASGGSIESRFAVVAGHPAVTEAVRSYFQENDAPALILAGGGGGTLRAVIEGLCLGAAPGSLPGRDRVRVAALRMGSGNVLAKQLGMPRDPEAGLAGLQDSLQQDRTVPCGIMRFDVGREGGDPDIRYAATLCGLGQLGRIPGDIERWHRSLPGLHALLGRTLGLERLTNLEYGAALFLRSVRCALRPSDVEEVEVRCGSETAVMRLFAGAGMNFRLAALPFKPGVLLEQPALSLQVIPYRGRWASVCLVPAARRLARDAYRWRLDEGMSLEIRLRDRETAEFFLNEDPMTFHRTLAVRVAGTLAFVPGPRYVPSH